MPHWLAGGRGFEARLLECEVPFRRAVCVVDEHERGVVFQSFCLLDHRDLILLDESFAEETCN